MKYIMMVTHKGKKIMIIYDEFVIVNKLSIQIKINLF